MDNAYKKNDLISIILPIYNAKNTLKRAIKSIINQTYPHWELILIDDGSSDNSSSIIKKMKDKRIKKIFLKKNMGLVYSLNTGIKASTGNYIARMDADDISLPERLDNQINFLKKNKNFDLVGSQIYVFDDITKNVIDIYPKCEKIYLSKHFYFSYSIPHPTWLAKSQFIKKYNYNSNNIYSEDQDLLIRGSISSNYFLMSKPLLLYSKSNIYLPMKLKTIKNLFFKKIKNYFYHIKFFRHKLIIYIFLDTIFFFLRALFYLVNNKLDSTVIFFKKKPINIPKEIQRMLEND